MVQVLTNLLVNAERHAYPDGGGGPVRIVLTSSSTTRTITVSDDGVGITPDALGQVFAPFFTTARGAGGSGLGLAIVRNLVNDAMRGEITADSDEGNGTTFVVTVPAGEHPQDLPAT